jgi:hypothetical protein
MGKKIGKFGFSVEKKKNKRKNNTKRGWQMAQLVIK